MTENIIRGLKKYNTMSEEVRGSFFSYIKKVNKELEGDWSSLIEEIDEDNRRPLVSRLLEVMSVVRITNHNIYEAYKAMAPVGIQYSEGEWAMRKLWAAESAEAFSSSNAHQVQNNVMAHLKGIVSEEVTVEVYKDKGYVLVQWCAKEERRIRQEMSKHKPWSNKWSALKNELNKAAMLPDVYARAPVGSPLDNKKVEVKYSQYGASLQTEALTKYVAKGIDEVSFCNGDMNKRQCWSYAIEEIKDMLDDGMYEDVSYNHWKTGEVVPNRKRIIDVDTQAPREFKQLAN